MTKVVVPGVIVAFLLFYIVTSPDQAASILHAGWALVVKMAHGIGSFVDKMAS